MGKLTGKKKAAFLARMAKGRKKKAAKRAKPVRKTAKVKSNSKPKRNMGKKTRRQKAKSFGKKVTSGNIFKTGLIGKAVLGIGAATVAGLVVNQVAPQFSGIVKPAAAFVAGGPIGGLASVVLSGDGFSAFGSMFGQNSPKTEVSV